MSEAVETNPIQDLIKYSLDQTTISQSQEKPINNQSI